MISRMKTDRNQQDDAKNPTKVLYKLCEHVLCQGGKVQVTEGMFIRRCLLHANGLF